MTAGFRFPDGFVWGTASSSYQVEGDNRGSQWWQFEQQPGAIAGGQRSGLACDWWRSAESDFDRMAALNLSACRLSIEWSRVEPSLGQFDSHAIERYRQMLSALHSRGLTPWVALHHFSNPLWFDQVGGFEHREGIRRWLAYVRRIVNDLGDLSQHWLTFNEPLVYLGQGWLRGRWPPRKSNAVLALRVFRHLLMAHGLAADTLREAVPSVVVGYAKAMRSARPFRADHPGDRLAAWLRRYLYEELWLQATVHGRLYPPLGAAQSCAILRDSCDFLGVNYYCRLWTKFDPHPTTLFGREQLQMDAETSDSGSRGPYSQYDPQGLHEICVGLRRFGKPIFVLENGLPDADDDLRPRWLLAHLVSLHQAIQSGADVRGYFHWTLVDNFEWDEGWSLRFGLFALEPRTQQRIPRTSAALYGRVAGANAVTHPMLAQFAPEFVASSQSC